MKNLGEEKNFREECAVGESPYFSMRSQMPNNLNTRCTPSRCNPGSECSLAALRRLAVVAAVVFFSNAVAQAQFGSRGITPPGGLTPTAPKKAARALPVYGPVGPKKMVTAVKVTGNKTISQQKVESYMRTRRDRPFDPEIVQSDVRRLVASGLFHDVRILTRETPQGIELTFEVFELPKINYIKFLGNDSVRHGALLKETDLKKGDSLNLYNVREARNRIEEFYRSKGFPDAEVAIAEGDKPHDLGVVFLVGEGNKQRVRSVKFVGNKIASDGRLKTQVKTKVGILWYLFRGEIDMGKIDEDVDRLTAYYRNLGYFRARVGRKLVFTSSRKWADLTFVIDEGPRYSVRDISFVGNQKFAAEDLKRLINLKTGEFFNQGMMLKDQNTLTDLYGGQGHIFASIKADPRFAEDTPELDVVFQVEEGEMYRVGKITVHVGGEFPHTRRNVVLNRVSLRPGDIVDIRKKRASERRLGASSLFVADPSKGDPPRIVLSPRVPDADGTQVANGAAPSFRGQSPGVYSEQSDARLLDLNIYVTPVELLQAKPTVQPPLR